MPVLLDEQDNLYQPYTYETERDFEQAVVKLADEIFGPATIYVDTKRRVQGSDIATIPDGYVIDMTDPGAPKLFVVENELVSHDPFRHIGIQMLKFVISYEDAQLDIRNLLMEEISRDPQALTRLSEGCERSDSRNIDNYLDQAVYGNFRGIVVIDEARDELHRVLGKINANISVLELKAYESESGVRLHLFDTLYDEYEETAATGGSGTDVEGRRERRERRAASDTIIVPARNEGFGRTFIGENRWYAIRIGAAMKDRVEYIAAYQVAPISAVTHIAKVQEIRPWKDTGKYVVVFEGPAKEIEPVPPKDSRYAPQGPVYVRRADLEEAEYLEDALRS